MIIPYERKLLYLQSCSSRKIKVTNMRLFSDNLLYILKTIWRLILFETVDMGFVLVVINVELVLNVLD